VLQHVECVECEQYLWAKMGTLKIMNFPNIVLPLASKYWTQISLFFARYLISGGKKRKDIIRHDVWMSRMSRMC
jgi:hypothetical protein